MLLPLDVLILLKIQVLGEERWTQPGLAATLGISSRSVNEGLRRLEASALYDPFRRRVRPRAMEEMLIHGLKYFVPAALGEPTRGMPTSWAAPNVQLTILPSLSLPVWPDPEGEAYGYSFAPLHPRAPAAARKDARLYELLALADAIREGSARGARLAEESLRERLRA